MSEAVLFSEPVLRSEDLSMSFREGENQLDVLKQIDFTLQAGERVFTA